MLDNVPHSCLMSVLLPFCVLRVSQNVSPSFVLGLVVIVTSPFCLPFLRRQEF